MSERLLKIYFHHKTIINFPAAVHSQSASGALCIIHGSRYVQFCVNLQPRNQVELLEGIEDDKKKEIMSASVCWAFNINIVADNLLHGEPFLQLKVENVIKSCF